MQKFEPRCHVGFFFAKNAHNPQHWTINSFFGAFLSGWVHLGPFRYCTKLAAKRAKLVQLMQKFVPRSRVVIFHNQRTLSTPLDPKLIFGVFHNVWVHLGAFRYCMKLGANQAELVQQMQKFVQRSRVGIFHIEGTQSISLNPKLSF